MILEKSALPTATTAPAILNDLHQVIESYTEKYQPEGIGVSIPGIVQKNGFLTTAGAIRSLYGFDLKAALMKLTKLPIHIDNDANTAAIAEQWIGSARGCENYLCLVLGTGFGGGIVINDQIYRGAHGMAGEFGWMVTKEIDLTQDLEAKSLNQSSAIVGGLCRQYTLARQQIEPDYPGTQDAREILTAAKQGEKLARVTLDNFYYDLGIGIIDLMACFDPEVVLVGGGISVNQEFVTELVATVNDLKMRHQSLNRIHDLIDIPVKPAKLVNDAGLVGAAYQIMKEIAR